MYLMHVKKFREKVSKRFYFNLFEKTGIHPQTKHPLKRTESALESIFILSSINNKVRSLKIV